MRPSTKILAVVVVVIALALVAVTLYNRDPGPDPASQSDASAPIEAVQPADAGAATADGPDAPPTRTLAEILKSVDAGPRVAADAPPDDGLDAGPTPIPDDAPAPRWPSDAGDMDDVDPRFYSGDADPGYRQIVEPTRPPPDGGQ